MGFFKKKKFPKYVKGSSDLSHLPSYESQMEDYAKPDKLPKPKMLIPKFPKIPKTAFEKPVLEKPSYSAFPEEELSLDIPNRVPDKFELREEPEESLHEKSYASLPPVGGTEPIYVKIEDYKKAVKSISIINDKLNEAEDLLNEVIDLKKEEDGQLSEWHREMAEIKSKLMDVHKSLFEVGR